MNKYTLQFNSREFEFAFFQNEKYNANIILKISTLTNIVQSIILMIYFVIENQAKKNDRNISIGFFIIGVLSWMIKFIQKKYSHAISMLLFIKNIILSVMIWISQMTENNDENYQKINYQPLLGVLLTIEILTSVQGTNFLYKIGLCIINLVLFVRFFRISFTFLLFQYLEICGQDARNQRHKEISIRKRNQKKLTNSQQTGVALYGDRSAGLIISISIGGVYFLCFIYLNDKQKRDLFLDKQKSIELSFLIDKLLPINIIVMKYNSKEERSFLHQVNRKAQNTFSITDNDTFKEFSKRVIIKPDTQEDDLDDSQDDALGGGKNTGINHVQRDQEKTLFFYVESIARENFVRQNNSTVRNNNDKRQSYKSEKNTRVGTRTERGASISKTQRNKMNSVFERPKKWSEEINKHNDRVNSGERDRFQRFSVFEPSKVSTIEKANNNSLERPKLTSIDRPKNISIEKGTYQSAERNKNNSQDKQNSHERHKKISFDKDRINNPQVPIQRSGFRSSTVKVDTNQANSSASGRFVRRGQKKGTVLRKVSNFNLKPGLADAKVKYGEDVYDRIDILRGIYTEKDGNQRIIQIKIYTYNVNEQYQVILIEDETLEGQVKYLTELNKFLYRSFQESLEQFRMPLAYTLLKLNNAFIDSNNNNNEEKHSPKSCINLNQIGTNTNYNGRTEGNRHSLTYIQQSEFSYTNISPISKQKHNNGLINNSQFQSYINNQFSKNVENFSMRNEETQFSQSMTNLQPYNQDSSRNKIIFHNKNDHSNNLFQSVDNTRYYGFLTLNQIYNYIDYITLLQKRQLELRFTEMSVKKVFNDIISIIENQGIKKQVKIIFKSELKYDKITSDERRIKQLMLNFLIHFLHKTKKGFIIIRASSNAKSLETIKISIHNSSNYQYPVYQKARFKLNTIDDIITARNNKNCLEQAINSQIIGRLGPYERIQIQNNHSSGTVLSFELYTDVNILNLPQKFMSTDDIDLQHQAAFKSLVQIKQEGEISSSSSYDANFAMNKLIVENINNIQSRQFFPSQQFQDIATIYDREEQPQSSKKQSNLITKNSLYFDYQNQNNCSLQDPAQYSLTPKQLEPFQQFNSYYQKSHKNNFQDDEFGEDNREKITSINFINNNDKGEDYEEQENSEVIEEFETNYQQSARNQQSNQKIQDKHTNLTKNNSNHSHLSKDSSLKINNKHNKIQFDTNLKKINNNNTKNNIGDYYQREQQKLGENTDSKYYPNNPLVFEQNNPTFPIKRNHEVGFILQQLQNIQPTSDTGGIQDDRNESKLSINQFSSRQLNYNQYSPNNNDESINNNINSGYYQINQQKLNIIKLQHSGRNDNNSDVKQQKQSSIISPLQNTD